LLWLACSGYMAPEYAIYGQFSAKSDVFSFGVLVLEIVSGQKNTGIRRWGERGGSIEFGKSFFSSDYIFLLLVIINNRFGKLFIPLHKTVEMNSMK